jgi:hypothetical protein
MKSSSYRGEKKKKTLNLPRSERVATREQQQRGFSYGGTDTIEREGCEGAGGRRKMGKGPINSKRKTPRREKGGACTDTTQTLKRSRYVHKRLHDKYCHEHTVGLRFSS